VGKLSELDLYKFCKDKELDWRGETLIVWVGFWDIGDFAKLIGYGYLSEGGMDACLLDDGIAIELNDLCEHFGIDPENILKKAA
jgi:hypothetical protein